MAVRDSVSMIKMILYGTGWLAELGVTPNLSMSHACMIDIEGCNFTGYMGSCCV